MNLDHTYHRDCDRPEEQDCRTRTEWFRGARGNDVKGLLLRQLCTFWYTRGTAQTVFVAILELQ